MQKYSIFSNDEEKCVHIHQKCPQAALMPARQSAHPEAGRTTPATGQTGQTANLTGQTGKKPIQMVKLVKQPIQLVKLVNRSNNQLNQFN